MVSPPAGPLPPAPTADLASPAPPWVVFIWLPNMRCRVRSSSSCLVRANGTLSPSATNVSVNIQLKPLSSLSVHVVRHDGISPADNSQVSVSGYQEDTDTNGDAFFTNIRVPGTYTVTAVSKIGGDLNDGA